VYQGLYVVFLLLLYYYVKKKRARHSFIQMACTRLCVEGERVRELREYALKTHNNIIIQLYCCTSATYRRNLNIMLRVTCNNVVQQHLTVVQQLQQLSLVVLSYYYHREIFAGGGHKKAAPKGGGWVML
jgi:hypothetical protein